MAQLLTLESIDPDQDINLYINSPGGSFTAMTAIYDTMQFVRPEIHTVCIGEAASAAAVLLAAGTPASAPPCPTPASSSTSPPRKAAAASPATWRSTPEILRMRDQQEEILARHTGRTPLEIRKDIERDRIFTAEQARTYHLIDDIYASRKRTLASTH